VAFKITVDDMKDSVVFGEKLMNLAGIVFRKHFYASYGDKEDLISIGVLKALTLLDDGNFDTGRGTLINFLYTGMRNEMHNYLYHKNKKVKILEDVKEFADDLYFESDSYSINLNIVIDVCNSFSMYGDLYEEVCMSLVLRGYIIKDRSTKVKVLKNSKITLDKFSPEFKKDLIDRLCGVIMWKHQESFL
jgi:hypothetical protein